MYFVLNKWNSAFYARLCQNELRAFIINLTEISLKNRKCI